VGEKIISTESKIMAIKAMLNKVTIPMLSQKVNTDNATHCSKQFPELHIIIIILLLFQTFLNKKN
jgi:hypothetical protein